MEVLSKAGMRKGGAILLTAAFGASVLAGCGGEPAAPAAGGDSGGGEKAAPEKMTAMTYWVGLSGAVAATKKSLNEVTVYQEIEKKTGVKVEFQHPPQGQEAEQFNLMITTGRLPDVIEYNWITFPGGPEKAISDSRIIKLNDYLEQYAPNLTKVLNEHPEWKKAITTDSGSIYAFPFLRGDKSLMVFKGPIVRQDWLDKLGLQRPTTIAEWETMLKAFKERDPNGNGKADEIPILLTLSELNLSHAFIGAWGITNSFYQRNGKVMFGPIQPEYKEFLALMNKWYKEGWLDKDFAATDAKLLDAKVTGHQIGSLIGNTGGTIGRFMGLMSGKEPAFKLAPTEYPVLQAGAQPLIGQMDQPYPGQSSAAISTSNKHVEETVKWLDFAFSEEGGKLFNFGKEGLTYNMDNGFHKYTDLIMNNPDKLPLSNAMAQHFRSSYGGPFVQHPDYIVQYANLPEQQEALELWMKPKNEMHMPIVTPNQEESGKYATLMADINTYKDEMFNKFVMGAEPLDNFDKFVAQLKTMGIEEAIQIQQAALERYNKR